MTKSTIPNTDYTNLLTQITQIYQQGQNNAAVAINTYLVAIYWQIGKYIIEFEQNGKQKAQYGKALIDNLSKDLVLALGKGFSRGNFIYMRLFYAEFPIKDKASHLLSWSHYVELLKILDTLERSFYLGQIINKKWSIPELKQQKKASLFLRLAASKDKEGILELAKKGQIIQKPTDLIGEPYILDFLRIPKPYHLTETEIKKQIIENTQYFLLELGKGFAFIGRQYRIIFGNRPHYVDLVFYHQILKCFVLIDFKKRGSGLSSCWANEYVFGLF